MTTTDAFDTLMEITHRPPIIFVEGHGSWLKDQTGKVYLDFIQGWAVNCLGHSPQVVVDALAKQAGTLIKGWLSQRAQYPRSDGLPDTSPALTRLGRTWRYTALAILTGVWLCC